MIEFLNLKILWDLFGLKAPWFSWLAALLLVLWPAIELIKLYRIYRRQSKNLDSAAAYIDSVKKEHPTTIKEGLHGSAIEKIRDYFQKVTLLMAAWNSFESHLIYRNIRDGENDRIWASESSELAFHEDAVLEYSFNKRFFLAIPGIVTGTGLLFTFLAILVALFGVSINPQTRQVVGLEGLIGGLSGKFVSSVAALFSATIFLMAEKAIFHRLDNRRKQLVDAIDNLIPRLSPLQLLVEIQRDTSGQSDAFRMFSADLATKLKNSLDQSMGPIMGQMVTAIDNLNQFTRTAKDEMITVLMQMNELLREAEHNKQDTISEQLQTLLKNIESAIVDSLSHMAQDFNNSISGSTMTQFQHVAETLGGTGVMLGKMNSQFEQSQEEMRTLIALTKDNFEKQLEVGQSQIVNIAAVLNKLSDNMKKTIEDTSLESSKFATSIIEEAGNLSAKSADQLRALLEKHGSELGRVEELEAVLRETLLNFNSSIKTYGQVTNNLQQVSAEVKSVVSSMSQVSSIMKEGQTSIRQTADLAKTLTATFENENIKQREVWQRIQKSMEDYEQLFKRVENNSKALTNEISRCLEAYNSATHSGFQKILGAANETMGNAVGSLSATIHDLEDLLEGFSEEIAKFNSSGRNQR